MADKIFCGGGKSVGQYGKVALSICLDDIPAEHIQVSKNGKRYVKIDISQMKEPKNGKTHYAEVNTWKPNQQTQQSGGADFNADDFAGEDVPF